MAQARVRLRHVIADHASSRNVGRLIYGTVVGLALVVALQAHPPPAAKAAGLILGAAVAVALAEAYSELISEQVRTRARVEGRSLRSVAANAGAVLLGAGFPAIFFGLAAVSAFSAASAYTLAKWTGLGLICMYGFVAGRLSGSGLGGALLHALAVGAIGGALIGLKSLFH